MEFNVNLLLAGSSSQKNCLERSASRLTNRNFKSLLHWHLSIYVSVRSINLSWQNGESCCIVRSRMLLCEMFNRWRYGKTPKSGILVSRLLAMLRRFSGALMGLSTEFNVVSNCLSAKRRSAKYKFLSEFKLNISGGIRSKEFPDKSKTSRFVNFVNVSSSTLLIILSKMYRYFRSLSESNEWRVSSRMRLMEMSST